MSKGQDRVTSHVCHWTMAQKIYIVVHLFTFEFKWGIIMVQRNVTLSLDEGIYEKYKEFCKKNAVALSRSIEVFMEEKIKKEEK